MTIEKGNNFFDNMRAKKKRGEKAAKPGHEDYPSKKQWKDITAKGETCSCCTPMQQASVALIDSFFERWVECKRACKVQARDRCKLEKTCYKETKFAKTR